MVTYHKVAELSQTDAAYIAGVIDGEGTITLTRKHRNENRQLAVTISNTEMRLLEFVFAAVGAGKITRKRTSNTKHTPSFTYAIYNPQALYLLEQNYPYLRTYKFDRSAVILRDYVALTPRNGKYSDEQLELRAVFEASVLSIKACRSRKLISHIITPLTVRSDDVSHRLLETARPFQAQVAVPIATQDYPFPVTGACASDDNNENSWSRFVSDDDHSTQ